jgi:hypothetical protein
LDWRFDGITALASIVAGKAVDLVVLAGNRATKIDDVERVETVFKDGVGYDPAWRQAAPVMDFSSPPNTRMQRTRLRSPLMRSPLGELEVTDYRGASESENR